MENEIVEPVVETVEPDTKRELVVEKSNKPTDEEARLLKENMKKKGQIEELSKKYNEADALVKQLQELGGIDALKTLVGAQKEAEQKSLEAKGDWERLKARMAEEHLKEAQTLKDRMAALENDVKVKSDTINELTIGTLFSSSKFIQDELILPSSKARTIYADHFDLEDGKVVGYDKPRGSNGRTQLIDGSGSPINFDLALRKIVESDPESDHLMRSKVKPGAGSSSHKPGVGSKTAIPLDSVSRIAEGLKGLKAR